jgi:hypothetical protein
MSAVPVLPAMRLPGYASATFGVFCPQCESVHVRGPRDEPRADRLAPCNLNSGSAFLTTGFEFAMAGEARSEVELMPDCVARISLRDGSVSWAERREYWRALRTHSADLRLAMLRGIVGPGSVFRGEFTAFLPRGAVSFHLGSAAWRISIQSPNRTFAGFGLLALARDLFGVSEASAARKLLEMVGGFSLPGERALILEAALEAALMDVAK